MPNKTIIQMPFPTTRAASFFSPAPRLNEKRDAEPIPISRESARQIVVSG